MADYFAVDKTADFGNEVDFGNEMDSGNSGKLVNSDMVNFDTLDSEGNFVDFGLHVD